jgi:mannose-6-phosphate isomerase-like protein (cupin superfamily)
MIIRHETVEPFDFDGLAIRDYTARHDGSSSLAEITVGSGVSHKLSWSGRSDKYYYVVRGKVLFTVDGEVHDLGAGDVCVVKVGSRFTYTNPGPEEAILILVHTPSFRLECESFEE